MLWWYWVVLGLALAALELATPGGFFIIFFGIAAIIVGLLELAGLAVAGWVQWMMFSVIAVAALALFRDPLLRWVRTRDGADTVDSLVGEVAVALGDIAPGGHGRGELRGSAWNARNVDTTTLLAGQRCRVVAVQGLTLDLRQE
jgi:membrane protein implicated in regulation of membrane protease activity